MQELTGEKIYECVYAAVVDVFAVSPLPWSAVDAQTRSFMEHVALNLTTRHQAGEACEKWFIERFYEDIWRPLANLYRSNPYAPIMDAWSALSPQTATYLGVVWARITGYWFGYNPDSAATSDDFAIGDKWKLKASGHIAKIIAINGDKVTIEYNRVSAEIEKSSLAKEATKQ